MKKFMTYGRNHKGITLVLMAIMLAVLLVFAALAIDIAYMYFEKNQLQVAADAAALAGAAVISDINDLVQTSARNTAIDFAAKNRTAGAAGATVQLITTYTNTDPILSSDNDISVGNWDGTQYNRGSTPVNAIEVVPKRVGGLSGGRGHVSLFLGKIFKFFDYDWSFMSAKARAVAAKPARASSYIALCTDACSGCTYPSAPCSLSPVRQIDKNACSPGSCGTNAAWTSLLTQPTGPGFSLNDLVCTTTPYVDVCANPIWTSNGEDAVTQRNLEADMYDPGIDSEAKICRSSSGVVGKCSEVVGSVQSWKILVPVTVSCPPGAQGSAWDPKAVFGYAKINVVAVCEQGVGNPCSGDRPCNALRPCRAPQHACDLYANNTIVIDEIQCISCADADKFGLKPVLVR